MAILEVQVGLSLPGPSQVCKLMAFRAIVSGFQAVVLHSLGVQVRVQVTKCEECILEPLGIDSNLQHGGFVGMMYGQ